MAISLTIALDSVCSGGGHVTISRTVDGGQSKLVTMDTDELRSPLTPEERDEFVALCTRVKLAGMTRAQARNTLQTGFTVTI